MKKKFFTTILSSVFVMGFASSKSTTVTEDHHQGVTQIAEKCYLIQYDFESGNVKEVIIKAMSINDAIKKFKALYPNQGSIMVSLSRDCKA